MKNLKELSLRIKNIKSVQKTTKIMQMISAAKLSKSQKRLATSRLYISNFHDAISMLLSSYDQEKLAGILNSGDENAHLVFVIASDCGLCGNFNSSVVKFSQKYITQTVADGGKVDVVFIGKKAFEMSKTRLNACNILEVKNSKGVELEHTNDLLNEVDLNKYGKVGVCYSKFYNTFTQKPTLQMIKPWDRESVLVDNSINDREAYIYECEPNNTEFILKFLIKDYIIGGLYCAILESMTSENSARMVAMESANRNTREMLNKLALLYNRSRQAAITNDLIEVVSGAEAL